MKKPGQSNVLLDEQAKEDARLIAKHLNLRGISAAIRYALRDVARQIERDRGVVVTSVVTSGDEATPKPGH